MPRSHGVCVAVRSRRGLLVGRLPAGIVNAVAEHYCRVVSLPTSALLRCGHVLSIVCAVFRLQLLRKLLHFMFFPAWSPSSILAMRCHAI